MMWNKISTYYLPFKIVFYSQSALFKSHTLETNPTIKSQILFQDAIKNLRVDF